MCVFGADLRFL